MKIFAKRKRQSAPVDNKAENDRLVQELLNKNNPDSWNAKQRRLIKRYRQRQAALETEDTCTTTSTSKSNEPTGDVVIDDPKNTVNREKADKPGKKEEPQDDAENGSSSSDDSDGDSSQNGSSGSDSDEEEYTNPKDDNSSKEERLPTKAKDDLVDPTSEPHSNNKEQKLSPNEPVKVDSTEHPDKQAPAATTKEHEKSLVDETLQTLLDQLQSKVRRRLTRELQRSRDYTSILQQAHALVTGQEKQKDNEPPPQKKRCRRSKGRQPTDWSTLSAEERLRREQQRQRQQQVAQERLLANGHANRKQQTSFTHPLNSERRRANRRKPKWKSVRTPNEHHTSGYEMRKYIKQEESGGVAS